VIGARTVECPTPFFTIDPAEIATRHAEFVSCFGAAEIFYAMKANSEPVVLHAVAACGAGFEIASAHELDLLVELGLDGSAVIYGSAIKPADQVRSAADRGVRRFALDSMEEADKLAAHAPGASVYVRVAVDDGDSVFHMSNKFGAAPNDVPAVATHARSLGLDVEGLSFNVGSQAGRATAWSTAIGTVGALFGPLAELGLPVRLLNLGGGYPGDYEGARTPSLAEITHAVSDAIGALPYPPETIALEPGRGLVASCATLTTAVVGRVRRGSREWLFLDAGAYNGLFEALACQGRTRYRVEPLRAIAGPMATFSLAGPTGDGLDIVAEAAVLPSGIRTGDRLLLRDVGAYSMTMATAFNGFPVPTVYLAEPADDTLIVESVA
jgi:ornithine decarboxylase